MSTLREHVDDYLRLRRALGFKLERHAQILPQLACYLEAAGASTVRSELAISWARLPAAAHPRHWAARLAIARGFAAYLQTIDPTTEVPPAGVFAVCYQRPTPYLWSTQDICRLLEQARALRPPLKAATFETLFGLLAVSGIRVGEAVALELGDVDLDQGVITIRGRVAKLERARLVPLHSTTVDALDRYADDVVPARDRRDPALDDRRRARPLRRRARAPLPAPEIESVLPLRRRHRDRPRPGEQDAPHDHDRERAADRDRPPSHT
jgi:integrase/recombinase XerD